ncbi:BON domain-containing protein [Sapientia aquatica]|uniref:Osmotically-inducible protein Y n=1 Tax=Sapientia aquatica TaxID=1549640 RepID=A0A4R5W421_9BURK|nr:BON domain-containing protein [Sapientia aquatica]TDK67095.1 BON domain-containing protein [Sapientia aquatica]
MKKNFNQLAALYLLGAVSILVLAACNKPPQTEEATTNATASSSAASSTTIGGDVDDSIITTKVKSALMGDENIKSIDFKITTEKGNVMLSGFVNNQMQIDRSIELAKAVTGVKNVTNQLTIKDGAQSMGNKIDDSVITTKVKSALLTDSQIKSFDIQVVTRNGEVQLSGFVKNDAQLKHAVDVAQTIEGVKSVLNHMTLQP